MGQIRVNTEEVRQAGRRLWGEARELDMLCHRLQREMYSLDTWSWDGRSRWRTEPLLEQVRPRGVYLVNELERLARLLQRVADRFEDEDRTAARNLEGMDWVEFGVSGALAGAAWAAGGGWPVEGEVPPRIYVVNGINAIPGADGLDDNARNMEKLLEQYGYDPDQVTALPCVYEKQIGHVNLQTNLQGTQSGGWLSPVDWFTGAGAGVVNWASGGVNQIANKGIDVANTVIGSGQVAQEYVLGDQGHYTQQTFDAINRDLAQNPLVPGQKIILIGHSGGGAIVSNLAGMVETRLGREVEGVVTLGVPVSNFDQASRYADQVVDIRHKDDNVGRAYLRSEEGRVGVPVALAQVATGNPLLSTVGGLWAGDQLARDRSSNISYHTVDGASQNAHNSYMNLENPEVNAQVMEVLQERFPSIRQATTDSPSAN